MNSFVPKEGQNEFGHGLIIGPLISIIRAEEEKWKSGNLFVSEAVVKNKFPRLENKISIRVLIKAPFKQGSLLNFRSRKSHTESGVRPVLFIGDFPAVLFDDLH